MKGPRKLLRVLIPILAAQITAMSLMIGAAALVIDRSGESPQAEPTQTASSEAPSDACDKRNVLDLIVF